MKNINLIIRKTLSTAGAVLLSLSVFAQVPQTPTQTAATPVTQPPAYTNTTTNYIRTWEPNIPLSDTASVVSTSRTVAEVKQSTQYYDGLGMLLQTVTKGISPMGRDLVQPVVYDALGREQIQYLPYIPQSGNMNDGKFKTSPFAAQVAFYNNRSLNPGVLLDTIYYGRTDFESSALNRPLGQFAPGNNWAKEGGNRPIKVDYLVNAVSDSVRVWVMPAGGGIPTSTAMYAAGQLYKNVTTDEQGGQKVEYRDKNGMVVLEKRKLASNAGTAHVGWLCTYNVYDGQYNLRFVIPPLAVEKIMGTWSVPAAVATGLCFQYQYDHRKRMIEKRIPGTGPVHMVYDRRDRLVFSQDSVQRSKTPTKDWFVTFFDGQNRAVMTALYPSNSTRTQLQAMMDTITAVNPQPNITGYQVMTYSYYDDYSYTGAKAYSAADTAKLPRIAAQYPEPLIPSLLTRGLMTGTKVRVLGTEQWLITTMRYDAKARVIQTLSDNLTGGEDVLTRRYDFSGKVLSTYLLHKNPASVTTPQSRVLTKYEYDAAGRVIFIRTQLNDNAGLERIIAKMEYNELGQLQTKRLGSANNGSTYLDNLNYEYTIRGWLKSINKSFLQSTSTTVSNWFGEEISYDRGYSANQYNGNIAGIKWKSGTNRILRSYGYRYDLSNRLQSAQYTQQNDPNNYNGAWSNTTLDFTVSHVNYDANGNILRMAQQGRKNNLNQAIDRFRYSYLPNTNQLAFVTDSVADANSPLGDFKESAGNRTSNESANIADYAYDLNGNLKIDANKDITSIAYNHLNLPQRILMKGKGIIDYTYDATGVKLRKRVTDSTAGPVKIITTDYISGFVYERDTLQFISHAEGRIRAVFKTGQPVRYFYDYFENDHLGNVRLVLTEQPDSTFYLASMEVESAAMENALFNNIDASRSARPVGYPEEDKTTDKNAYVAKLNGTDPDKKIGPSIVLRVTAGDTIAIGAKAFYKSSGPVEKKQPLIPAADMAAALARSFASAGTAEVDKTTGALQRTSPFNEGFFQHDYERLKEKDPGKDAGDQRPKAYLNFVLFDDEFNMVEGNSGVRQVQAQPDQVQVLGQDKMVMERNGFLYVYTSNETPEDVYFDEIMVVNLPGPVLEETHYYPFGLTIAGISTQAPGRLENKLKYNTKELQHNEFSNGSGLEWYDYGTRLMDPQIGRWHVPDPLSSKYSNYSPYNYVLNDPVQMIDPDGMDPLSWGTGTYYEGAEAVSMFLTMRAQWNSNDGNGDKRKSDRGKKKVKRGNALALPALEALGTYAAGSTSLMAPGGISNFAKQSYWEEVANGWRHTFNSNRIDYALHGGYIGLLIHEYFKDDPIKGPDGLGEVIPSPGIVVDPALALKMYDELTHLFKKILNNPGFVYALIAKSDGEYNVYVHGSNIPTGKKEKLKAGDVWKYGESTSGKRYGTTELNRENVRMVPLWTGSQLQIKAMEKYLIYGHYFLYGELPAGNKMFR